MLQNPSLDKDLDALDMLIKGFFFCADSGMDVDFDYYHLHVMSVPSNENSIHDTSW